MNLTPEEKQSLKRIMDLPPAKRDLVFATFRQLLTDLKAEREARPESHGRTVTYSELMANFIKDVKEARRGGDADGRAPNQ